MGSNAVSSSRVSRIVGYEIDKGNFETVSPNLPQSIALLGEANDANQNGLDLTPTLIINAQQAGNKYGYGSPIYSMMRILEPVNGGGGVQGIPVTVYPQLKAVGAKPKIVSIASVGVADNNGTHFLVIAGREGVDSIFYTLNISVGDTTAIISGKISDAINSILGSPVTAADLEYESLLTTKWSGLTAEDLTVSVDTGNDALGLSYNINVYEHATGVPSIEAALEEFLNIWHTIVINSYGTDVSTMMALEAFNGIADPSNPSGRYTGIVMKPFIALTGSLFEDPSSITDTKLIQMTIAICPAPLSPGFGFEAAANAAVLYANKCQNTPELDIAGQAYPDMPTPSNIGAMSDYNTRDAIVKKGCSTVDLISGQYVMQDFVTTYHPIGETPPQFRYCRNLDVDFNVRYTYYLLEQLHVVDHVIANDNDIVNVDKVVKPKTWKAVLGGMFDDLVSRGLIVDAAFSKASLKVRISTSNPDRLETTFSYKRSGVARIASTTVTAGFNFGTLN